METATVEMDPIVTSSLNMPIYFDVVPAAFLNMTVEEPPSVEVAFLMSPVPFSPPI